MESPLIKTIAPADNNNALLRHGEALPVTFEIVADGFTGGNLYMFVYNTTS
jgi:hypothetical protein